MAVQERLFDGGPFDDYVAHLTGERRLSPRTIDAYTERLYDLAHRVGKRFLYDLDDQPTADDLRRYIRMSPHLSIATINLTLSAFRSWRRFGVLQGWWFLGAEVLVEAPRGLRTKRPPLTPGQTERLLLSLRTPPEWRVVCFGLFAGCRISETIAMRPRHWLDDRLRFAGKGPGGMSKIREVPLHPVLAERRDLLMDNHWSMSTYQRAYEGLRARLGFHFSPHTFRRTFDTKLRDEGNRGDVVDELMGHEGVTTAHRHYTHISWTLKVEAMETVHYCTLF